MNREYEYNEVLSLFAKLSGEIKVIAYHPIYSEITGGITTGLLLSQLLYWAKTVEYKEFYKTDDELAEELSMGIREFQGAKKRLKEMGYIVTKRKGAPPKTYYEVNVRKVIDEIIKYRDVDTDKNSQIDEKRKIKLTKNAKLNLRKTQNQIDEKRKNNTENTTENTTENNIYNIKNNSFFVVDENNENKKDGMNKDPSEETRDLKEGNDMRKSNQTESEKVRRIYEKWNEQGLVRHRKLTDMMKRRIRARLRDYSVEQIEKAIENYAKIQKDGGKNYWWTYLFTLDAFMREKNLVKFLDESNPFENYARKDKQVKNNRDVYIKPDEVNETRKKMIKEGFEVW